MKRLILLGILFIGFKTNAQITNVNQYPTLNPDYLNFIFSMRQVNLEYDGPLIRLRRSSDNAEQDFFPVSSGGMVNNSAITTFKGSATSLFVTKWYDQSGNGNDAAQTSTTLQPAYTQSTTKPFFVGDASNDYLEIPVGLQNLTDSGRNGVVIAAFNVSTTAQFTFGVCSSSSPADRWSGHMNWSDNNVYFDPGICCNSPRSFANGGNVGVWRNYSFIRTTDSVITRLNGATQFAGTHTTGRCTSNNNFWLCGANNLTNQFSDTKFMEFVMFSTNVDYATIKEYEDSQITFWGL